MNCVHVVVVKNINVVVGNKCWYKYSIQGFGNVHEKNKSNPIHKNRDVKSLLLG